MRVLTRISSCIVMGLLLVGTASGQQEDLITVKDSGTHILPASKTLTVRNIRSMKLNVVTGSGQQISYTASITANKLGMERHFGDGKLKFTVVDQAGLLEYKPISQPERREESWLKSLFTKEVRYDAKVERAEMTLTVPDDVLLTIDSQYSDISVGGLKRALSILGRNGVVSVKDHFGDIRIDNMFGNVNISDIRGDANISSRSSKVVAENIEGRFALTGQSVDFRGVKLQSDAIIDNHRGKNHVLDVGGEIRVNSNYGEIVLSNVRGTATIGSQYPARVHVERVEGLRAHIERGEISMENVGSSIGVSVTGKYAKVTGSGIDGSLTMEGERNTVDVQGVDGDAIIRNSYGTVSLEGVEGKLMISGNNNTIDVGNVSGDRVDIDQSRSTIKGDFGANIRRISITNSNGDIDISVGSAFAGRYTFRNEGGLIQHNLGGSLFSEEINLVREISGGNPNAQTELRVVNRNGRLVVRKQ